MRNTKSYLLGMWMFAFLFICRVALLAYVYYQLTQYPPYNSGNLAHYFFTRDALLPIILPLVEAIIYWVIRFRIYNKKWVHVHVWTSVAALLLLPFFPVLYPFLEDSGILPHTKDAYSNIMRLQTSLLLALFLTGHIFFITTIVKSFKRKKQPAVNEDPGLLDEFVK